MALLKPSQIVPLFKQSIADFLADDAMSWAAAVAYYTALSFAPLVLLLVSVTGWLGQETQDGVVEQARELMGREAGQMIDTVAENAQQSGSGGVLPFIIGLAVALFSASGVFGQLQLALNRIWAVKAAAQTGWFDVVRKRLLSIGMVAVLAFLMLVSLVASSVLGYFLPAYEEMGRVVSVLVSLLVLTPLFMVMFRYLPDADIAWNDVIFGAVLTAILFIVGKELIGLYLSHAAVGSAYGAAGSLVVLLVWVYYSAVIVLMGAEITQARAKLLGHGIVPEAHATRDDVVVVRRESEQADEALAGVDPLV